ncbi:MAG: phage head morphogenesis protein [Clostridiales bacterium]|nr:phage head morphogenesis protein [Clostridiales bacterium]
MPYELPNDLANEISNGILGNKQAILLREYQKSLNSIRSKLQEAYAKYADRGLLDLEIMSKYGRLEKLEENVVIEMNRLLKKSNTTIKSGIKGTFKSTYYSDTYMLSEATSGNFSFAVINEKQLEETLDSLDKFKWPDRLKGNIEANTRQVQSDLMQGLIQGLPYNKVSRNIADKMGMGAYKSYRMVRTECHNAQEAAHQRVRRDLADKVDESEVRKIWEAVLDTRTRSAHAQMDGQEVKVDEKFKGGGYSAIAPGQFGIASQDINCRCTTRTVVLNPQFETTTPNRSYAEYYEEKTGKKPAYMRRVDDEDVPEWVSNRVAQRFKNTEDAKDFVKYKRQYDERLEWKKEDLKRNARKFDKWSENDPPVEITDELRSIMKEDEDLMNVVTMMKRWQKSPSREDPMAFKLMASKLEDGLENMCWIDPQDAVMTKKYLMKHYDRIKQGYIKMRALNQSYLEQIDFDIRVLYRGIHGEPAKEWVDNVRGDVSDTFFNDRLLAGYSSDEYMADMFGYNNPSLGGGNGITFRREVLKEDVIIHRNLIHGVTGEYPEEMEYICAGITDKVDIEDVKYKFQKEESGPELKSLWDEGEPFDQF